jgi:hypothetical protein
MLPPTVAPGNTGKGGGDGVKFEGSVHCVSASNVLTRKCVGQRTVLLVLQVRECVSARAVHPRERVQAPPIDPRHAMPSDVKPDTALRCRVC